MNDEVQSLRHPWVLGPLAHRWHADVCVSMPRELGLHAALVRGLPGDEGLWLGVPLSSTGLVLQGHDPDFCTCPVWVPIQAPPPACSLYDTRPVHLAAPQCPRLHNGDNDTLRLPGWCMRTCCPRRVFPLGHTHRMTLPSLQSLAGTRAREDAERGGGALVAQGVKELTWSLRTQAQCLAWLSRWRIGWPKKEKSMWRGKRLAFGQQRRPGPDCLETSCSLPRGGG